MREWQQAENGQAALLAQKRRDKARRRALSALAERHVAEFDALIQCTYEEIERKEQDQDE